MITLRAGEATCRIAPGIGGSIASWTIAGQPMLRSTPAPPARDARAHAAFPLVPYSNRIAKGAFVWNGVAHRLTPNLPPEPHAIHGVGFQRAWSVPLATPSRAVLRLVHTPDADWPFGFEAHQTITLTDTALQLDLTVQNAGGIPAPFGFGHHPYFDTDGAALRFTASLFWPNDADTLPLSSVPVTGSIDFTRGQRVSEHAIDNCYTGWDGRAGIIWAGRPLALEITASPNLPALVVYIPPGGEAFCAEPAPNLTNSLNRHPDGPALPILAPGETFSAWIRFDATTRAS